MSKRLRRNHLPGFKALLGRYFEFYNTARPHSRLDHQTPDQVYFNQLPLPRAA